MKIVFKMVDLVSRYSKRDDLAFELEHARQQLAGARETGSSEQRHSVQSAGRVGKPHGLQDRLSDADRKKIVLAFEAGELRVDIAERCGISVSSVARVLRKHREETREHAM